MKTKMPMVIVGLAGVLFVRLWSLRGYVYVAPFKPARLRIRDVCD